MKKAFELFLVFIIFYGVYAAFDQVAPLLFEEPQTFWVVITSFLTATLLLVLYSWIISSTAQEKYKQTVSHLKEEITKKDQEIKTAQSFKEIIVKEAKETMVEETDK